MTAKIIEPKTEKKLASMARQELKRRGKSDQEIERKVESKIRKKKKP